MVSVIENDTEKEAMDTLKNSVAVGNQQVPGSLKIDVESLPNPYKLFAAIIYQAVRTELAYDPSIGTHRDFVLIAKVIHKEYFSIFFLVFLEYYLSGGLLNYSVLFDS